LGDYLYYEAAVVRESFRKHPNIRLIRGQNSPQRVEPCWIRILNIPSADSHLTLLRQTAEVTYRRNEEQTHCGEPFPPNLSFDMPRLGL